MKERHDGVILHGGEHLDSSTKQHEHVEHCFDYLRQALMCSADTTIEHAMVEGNGNRIQVDGWGATHKCKNWYSLWEFVVDCQAPEVIVGIA